MIRGYAIRSRAIRRPKIPGRKRRPKRRRRCSSPMLRRLRPRRRRFASASSLRWRMRSPARSRARWPADLPPDAPLEPGSGGRRVRAMAGAIDRIAGADAAPVATPPVAGNAEPTLRTNFVAVARRAAQAVAGEQSAPPSPTTHFAVSGEPKGKRTGAFVMRFGPQIKAVIVGISVVAIVLGALRLALDLFAGPGGSASAPATEMQAPDAPPIAPPAMPANPPTPGKGAGLGSGTRGAAVAPEQAPRAAQPAAVAPPPAREAAPKSQEVRDTAAPAPVLARDIAKEPLPAAIGSKALIAAATSGDPAASYEVGARFADGTAVPQDLTAAASWFERAARRGIVMAQFRLGTMYEKGLGLKKDLQEARRLYLLAADKGNAKAMHNLAVLYAEGIDGKPDYPTATQWFRKAATYGLPDSEYNLAILYARGVGIERNLAESYKWLALVGPRRRQGCRQEGPRHCGPPRRTAIERRTPGRRKLRPAEPTRRCGVRQNPGRRMGPGDHRGAQGKHRIALDPAREGLHPGPSQRDRPAPAGRSHPFLGPLSDAPRSVFASDPLASAGRCGGAIDRCFPAEKSLAFGRQGNTGCEGRRPGEAHPPAPLLPLAPSDRACGNLSPDRRPPREHFPVAGDGARGRIHLRHVRHRRRVSDDAAAHLHRGVAGGCGGDGVDPHRRVVDVGRGVLLAPPRHRCCAGTDAAGRRHRRHSGRGVAVHLSAHDRPARHHHRRRLRRCCSPRSAA